MDHYIFRYCPVCGRPSAPTIEECACAKCHAARLAALRVLEARYQGAEDLCLTGQAGDYPAWLVEGMRGKQRRVIRKSESMGG